MHHIPRRILWAIVTLIVLQIKEHVECKSETPSNCGRRLVNHEALIVNGYAAKEGYWPWHSNILHISTNLNIQYMCGGTLLNSDSILTAAHCVYENGRPMIPERILIQLGRQNLLLPRSYSQEIKAYETFPHHKFNESNLANDIAIIRLATKASFNDYVRPACLWDSAEEDISSIVGKYGTVVGFGITEDNELSLVLREATIPVVSLTTCLDSDRNFFGQFLSGSTFCAGYTNETTTCNGDSGGSLTFEDSGVHRIRGIVSLTQARTGDHNRHCKTDQYVVFTDVVKYLQWIQEKVPGLESSTEYGTLEIRFDRGQARIDNNGEYCDNCILCYNKCDPYMRVIVDGVQKFRTSTVWDNESPHFDAVFTSEPISKDATIAIEMWDDDAGDTVDDLMARWEHLKFGSTETHHTLESRQNSIHIYGQWK